jgi:hypothetical protein
MVFNLGNMKLAVIALLLPGSLVQGQESRPLALRTRIELANINRRIDHFGALRC